MARTTVGIQATSLNDAGANSLVTLANAALAGLVNPIIRGFTIQPVRQPRRASFEFNALLTYDTGGSAIATPWLLAAFLENSYSTLLSDLVTAYGTTYSGYFIAAPQFLDVEDNPGKLNAYIALLLVNSTSGASANFLPLVMG